MCLVVGVTHGAPQDFWQKKMLWKTSDVYQRNMSRLPVNHTLNWKLTSGLDNMKINQSTNMVAIESGMWCGPQPEGFFFLNRNFILH